MSKIHQKAIIIVDRSGSMRNKEKDTVGGINTYIETLKPEKDDTTSVDVSIKLFDHEEIMLIRSKNINDVRPIESKDFVPRGATALLDAIGNSLAWVMENKLINPEFYTICVFCVVTDGLENSSKYYSSNKIKTMIKEATENYNIKFTYLGANQDAILEAEKYGITPGEALNYSETPEHTSNAYRSAANLAKRARTERNTEFTDVERCASQI